ncbi:MAG: HAD family hydrolase [Actinomycetota bacterium]
MPEHGVLLLDLDGTTCRGDEAFLEYARLVDAGLTETGLDAGPARSQGQSVTAALEAFLDGTGRDGPLATAQDGYQVVTMLAEHAGAPVETVRAAFRTVRAGLASGDIPAEAPPGLDDLLGRLRSSGIRVVIVTNAPSDGLDAIIDRLGLGSVVDEVVGDAGKPTGLVELIDGELRRAGAVDEPWRLLSVGDIWEYDLRPALARRCVAMYVDRFDRRRGPAHAREPALEGLYDPIRQWVSITMSPPSDVESVHAVYPPLARE